MKKKILIGLIIVMVLGFVLAYALPCTDMWSACVDKNGYPNSACDALWDLCIALLY